MDLEGVLVRINPRRGRGPASVVLKGTEGEQEFSTFDVSLIKEAAGNINSKVKLTIEEKQGKKNPEKTYKNLVGLTVLEAPPDPLQGPQEAPGSTNGSLAISGHPLHGEVVSTRQLGALEEMEEGYRIAQRRHQLVLDLLKSRLKEGTHWVDGTMFGSKKPVLLQPGAHAIFQAVGFSCDPKVISGPLEPPSDPNMPYTLVVRAEVHDLRGRFVGAQMGSCSSHIWSNKAGRYVTRAVDPDKTLNSTLKMATKRATVAACRQTTPASELFAEDAEEGGYGTEGKG